ncbi:MAG: DUF7594 domain-containing protein, partial [Acidimicrobiia bacterium]
MSLVAASPLAPFPGSPAGAETLTVGAAGDATAFAEEPDAHEGGSATLEVDRSPEKEAFVRFSVPALPGAVRRATLRLFTEDGSGNGPEVYRADSGWAEDAVSWSQRPARQGSLVADTGDLDGGTWATWDVTEAVSGAGTVAFALVPDSSDGADFASRQAGNHPELVLEVGDQPSGATSTFTPVADARVDENHPDENYGSSSTLSSQGEPDPPMESYLRFDVSGLAAAVQRATLRLFVTNDTDNGPKVYAVDGDWDEDSITWENRPGHGLGILDDLAAVEKGWVSFDVTEAVDGNGPVNLVFESASSDSFSARSREASSSERPQLVVETGSGTTTSGPTTTTRPSTTTTALPSDDCDPPDWRPAEIVGKLPSGYAEMSGLVGSTRYPGWAWGVRDSGNPASLYAFRVPSSGDDDVSIREFPVPGTSNSDWEDVAYTRSGNGPGTLWILENR